MKIQNLAIIFLVIILPILMILGYYLKLQEDTLKKQSEYNAKLSSSVKEGIRAYEINTVNWREKKGEERRNVTASVNTFLTSLANNLNISGTSKEYMVNYVPAVAVTMYSGYYIYSPAYVSDVLETEQGVQLYFNGTELTTEYSASGALNDVAYKPASGATSVRNANYTYVDETGKEIKKNYTFTTDAAQALKAYKHSLSNQIAYSGTYKKGTVNVTINYTLDNRIYIYGKDGVKDIQEQGNLVYFDNATCKMPRITVSPGAKDEKGITVNTRIDETKYFDSNIEPEILTEQISYRNNSGKDVLGTFMYIYDITNEKLYYDGETDRFFTLNHNREKSFLSSSEDIKAGDNGCRFKSVSVLTSDSTYKKLYQALNGRDKGKWYIGIKEDSKKVTEVGPGVEIIDTEFKETAYKFGFSPIYVDYSAISYYVEAYAFTNWMKNRLGGEVIQTKIVYDEETKQYKNVTETLRDIFVITKENDMEVEGSTIWEHKRNIMIDSINSNLNLSISSYSRNSVNEYKLPVLSSLDWDQVFKNLSMIAFFQGVPIGLKTYNNYAIATSSLNRDYVDPDGIFFSCKSQLYHRPYCTKITTKDIEEGYTGYRSVEYTLRTNENKDKTITYYYQHDQQATPRALNKNSELACYECIVNKANYERTIAKTATTQAEKDIKNVQVKAYKEALARERYYQNVELAADLGIMIRYHENVPQRLFDLGIITGVSNMPEDQEAMPNEMTQITTKIPVATTSDPYIQYRCVGWSKDPSSTVAAYDAGAWDIFEESVDLYAIWTVALAKLNWKTDWYWTWTKGDPTKDYGYFKEGGRDVARVNDGSISHGIFKDDSGGSIIEMEGNGDKPGKGACWTEFSSDFLQISEFSFDFNVARGDSFAAAGFMFNIVETSTELEGYLFSINLYEYGNQFYSKAGNKRGSIYKFRYKKEKNSNLFESLELVQAFDVPVSGSGRDMSFSGSVRIKVTDTGYIFTSSFSSDVPINTGTKTSSFGFFSEHYGHGCDDIGYFKLHNIKVAVILK